jgi:N-acetylglucosamine-6-phosphate deacetylase
MEATGNGDGDYNIAGMPVIVKNGKALTIDGALAGSTLELVDGVRNLVRFAGASLEDAIACATVNPAKMLGIDNNCGSLEAGKYADFIIAHEDPEEIFVIDSVILGGIEIK